MATVGTAGSSEGPTLKNLSEEDKRWLAFGVALNRVLVAESLSFLEQEIQKGYNNLKSSHRIDTQCWPNQLKKWLKPLDYKNINNNDACPKLPLDKLDYKVSTHVDFAKLYLQKHMIKFNAFDERCDASAVLSLLARMPVFPDAVRNAADAVRKARNAWAHCVSRDWDDASFQKRFQEMEELVINCHLPKDDKDKLLKDLCDWKDVKRIMNASVDPEDVKCLLDAVVLLRKDVDKLVTRNKLDDKARTKNKLENVENVVKDVWYELQNLSRRVDQMQQESTAQQAQTKTNIDELQMEHNNLERRVADLEDQGNGKAHNVSPGLRR